MTSERQPVAMADQIDLFSGGPSPEPVAGSQPVEPLPDDPFTGLRALAAPEPAREPDEPDRIVCCVQLQVTRGAPTPEKAESLRAALAVAKDQLRDLRARIIRADSVASAWVTVPSPDERGAVKRECGEIIRRIFGADGDLSMQAAREQLAHELRSGS